MPIFYLRDNTGAILNQAEYDKVPHHNPNGDNYSILGEFKNKSEAIKYYKQMYLPQKQKA